MTFSFETEERQCPVCNSIAWRRESTEEVFWLARCSACGMVYTHNPPTIGSKLAYYAARARRRKDTGGGASAAFYTLANQIKSVPLYSVSLRAIRDRYPRGTVNIADVGCGGGLFLLGAQAVEDPFNIERAPRFNVRGVAFDPMEKRDTEKHAGCPVFMIDHDAEQLTDWANVATMFNVLEHVNDPAKCLRIVRQILRDDGLLVVDVPNNQVVAWRGKLLKRWPRLDLGEHINHFTPQSLDRLMERSGFRPVSRLPGLVQGAAGFGTRPTAKQRLRWLLAAVLFFSTWKKLQIFPHMTVLYVKKPHSRG